jgi:hypothetical protein
VRGVVDAIADHEDSVPTFFQLADRGGLVLGQQAGANLGDPDLVGQPLGGPLVVPGQQHR